VDIEFRHQSGRNRWTTGEHSGWADSREEVIETVKEILLRPYRGVRMVGQRTRFRLV
jgi:hypothetical protein